ncbi:hypothetical protein SAMN05192574_105322 [Mucilaginibacter gossypiicola]|uniref:Uncharacterized protein n=1 Tax=Mucilaginibacter gossypiicola TaxID=551995 RepID=A0A1H8M0A3_9SPHI|nr:hypothetical protein [Mucilaginibacter gossypiicola]SEO10566.1 hypothetical protein SAMN05192574_105322 [Mucilaginibacter gossypiicola]
MKNPEDVFFKSESQISPLEIVLKYGKINPWEFYFRLAEHKNFEAAKAVFERWDDDLVRRSDAFLVTRFVHSEWAKEERKVYLAHCYLMRLIRERNVRDPFALENDDQEDIATLRRLAGILPQIDIGGTAYHVDWEARELREIANPAGKIDINAMELNYFKDGYEALYNSADRQLYAVQAGSTELPPDVFLLHIPYEMELDPVAVARERGLDDLAFTNGHPVRSNLKGYLWFVDQATLSQMSSQPQDEAQAQGRRTGR